MTNSELEELSAAVEEIRKEMYSHIPLSFLRAVLLAEQGSPDDDQSALREISRSLGEIMPPSKNA